MSIMDILYHLGTNQPAVLCINAVLCIAIMGICICRLNAMDRGVLLRTRFEYVFYMVTGFISMARPWWGENVGWASLMLESGILFGFLSSSHAWPSVRTPEGFVDAAPESSKGDQCDVEIAK